MIDVSKTSTAAGATPAPVVYVVDDDPRCATR